MTFESLDGLEFEYFRIGPADPNSRVYTFILPTNQLIEIMTVQVVLTTDATAGNRRMMLRCDTAIDNDEVGSGPVGGSQQIRVACATDHAPSTTKNYYFQADCLLETSWTRGGVTEFRIPFQRKAIIKSTPTWSAQIVLETITTLAAGDRLTAISMLCRRYISQQRLTLM